MNLPLRPCGYSLVLANWKKAWSELRTHTQMEISEINSIHIINDHLEEYYDLTKESLVKYSDQTVESAHQWVDKVLKRTNNWVKNLESDAHGEHLFRGIMTHNTYTMDSI